VLRVQSHKANIVQTILRANGGFREAILEPLHSVSCQYDRDM